MGRARHANHAVRQHVGQRHAAVGAVAARRDRAVSRSVQITSDGRYFDQTGTTTVTVQNTALPPFEPGLLFYDDDPEHVDRRRRALSRYGDVQRSRRGSTTITTIAHDPADWS